MRIEGCMEMAHECTLGKDNVFEADKILRERDLYCV